MKSTSILRGLFLICADVPTIRRVRKGQLSTKSPEPYLTNRTRDERVRSALGRSITGSFLDAAACLTRTADSDPGRAAVEVSHPPEKSSAGYRQQQEFYRIRLALLTSPD